MSLNSMPEGKAYSEEGLQSALLCAETFIEHKRWNQLLEDYPYSKQEGDNVCEDTEKD